jgi:rhodanese-related sulfurtransferase
VPYTQILYARLRELLDEPDTQLVEVLPPPEYEERHLPGAINIPLKTLDERTTASLDKAKAVVVYCWDGI